MGCTLVPGWGDYQEEGKTTEKELRGHQRQQSLPLKMIQSEHDNQIVF